MIQQKNSEYYASRVVSAIQNGDEICVTHLKTFEKRKDHCIPMIKVVYPSTRFNYRICTPQDMDRNGCMNNARYLRELDFARFLHSSRNGLFWAVIKKGTTVVGASVSHYYHGIPVFTPYRIVTKALYWEEKYIYMHQKCITLHDNLVRAESVTKQVLIGPEINMIKIVTDLEPNTHSPDLSEDLKLWIESLEETSKKFRKNY
ncbi:protein THEM6-like isoform X1 [Megachile rotundata]|uniref:protein THEM6-like isoform X1 n=1 Tax=Megachile rotundata TaxID=143995 RepID=UPI003FD55E4A